MRPLCRLLLLFSLLLCLIGCSNPPPDHTLTILAGRGLKNPMEEVRTAFIDKYGIKTHIVYGGSGTLLAALKRSNQGDVFVPGSLYTLEAAGDMIVRHVPVALHTPVIALNTTNPKGIKSLSDLAAQGVKVGIANKEMAALGRTSEEIFAASGLEPEIMANVIIKAQNVSLLLGHLIDNELDAAILWSDMLLWPEAKGLTSLAIPPEFNKQKEIHAALLRQSKNPKEADLFVDFMAQEGAALFRKHGFEMLP